jgi:threonylcarbamoyladenosine tRNA methylthiotransferase MtaB
MSQPDDNQSEFRYQFTIHTYGCKVNTYDTGLLQMRLEKQGHQPVAHDVKGTSLPAASGMEQFGLGARVPRIHILNTCAVTAEATRDAAKQVRRLKSKDPFSTVVVTGCGAQVDGKVYDDLPGADLVVANSHKGLLERLLDQHFKGTLSEKVFRSNIFRKEDLEAGGGLEAGHTRAFLKIQDGCNSFCTYCVIPFARGKSRSIPVAELVTRIRDLHARGVNEVVLTGVHIGDYEDERGTKTHLLHDLVEEVLSLTDVPRVRLTSLEPPELTPELMKRFANGRLCPHFHMSIQSASSKVLAAMKRKYDALAVEESLLRIAREIPHAFVGMDVIVGFPGETDEDFAETYERLARLPWTRIHVFPYSERPGTKAVNLEGSVERSERLLRSQRLRELSTERFAQAARSQIGLVKQVMILKANAGGIEGLSRDYWPVRIGRAAGELSAEELHELSHRVGRELRVRILGYDDSNESRMEGILTGSVEDA